MQFLLDFPRVFADGSQFLGSQRRRRRDVLEDIVVAARPAYSRPNDSECSVGTFGMPPCAVELIFSGDRYFLETVSQVDYVYSSSQIYTSILG